MMSDFGFQNLLPLAQQGGSFWFPPQSSSVAGGHDFTYDLILWICVVFFVGICGATLYFMIKYRKRPGHEAEITSTHNTRLEIAWSVIPLLILMVIFGVATYWYLAVVKPPPEDVFRVDVVAKRWNWSFKYQDVDQGKLYQTNELLLVKDRPYQMMMTTPQNDVIHSMFIPAFRVKQDCVPGRYNKLWFKPTRVSPPEGFHLFCTEYCGRDHSNMVTRVHVYENEEEWAAAVREKGDITRIEDLVERGRVIYENDCATCHNITGDILTGPNFGGLWGTEETMTDGETVTVDEAYVRESVIEPGARVVEGFPPNGMTPFSWGAATDDYMDGIYAFLKSVEDEE